MKTNDLCLKWNKIQQIPSCLMLVEYILPSHVRINYCSSNVIYQCLHLTDCSGWHGSLVIFIIFKWMEPTGFYWSFKGNIIGFQYASHVLWVWRIKSKGVVFLMKTQQWNEILLSSSFTPQAAEHNISSKCFCLSGISCKFDCFKRWDKEGGVELVGRCLMIL